MDIIEIFESVTVLNGRALDVRHNQFASLAAAKAGIISDNRYLGLTVSIDDGGSSKEYWWKSGLADGDLVQKLAPGMIGMKTIVFADFEADLITVNDTDLLAITGINIRSVGPLIPTTEFTQVLLGGFVILYPGWEASADTCIHVFYEL